MNPDSVISVSVLFVDAKDILAAMVQEYGPVQFAVYQASFGKHALDVLGTNSIDILVVDWPTSQMSGVQWIHEATARQESLQVILLGEALQLPFVNSVSIKHTVIDRQKPNYLEELHQKIERCMAIKKIKDDLDEKENYLKKSVTHGTWIEQVEARAMATRLAISALLETSLEPLTLVRQSEVILEIILTIPCFSGLRQGVLFLMDEVSGNLHMVGHKNLLEPLLALCAQVPLGHCLCGKAAQAREIIFQDHLTQDHDTRCEGMVEHGHYCVPIVSKERLFGLLCLNLPAGHQRQPEEDSILFVISNTLALILAHRHTEGELRKAEEHLRFMAYHDPLTGLHNRQYFDIKFNKIFTALQSSNRRQNAPPFQGAFLAIFDIDHFKRVNDTYGHMMGDEVLVLFARVITDCFRDKDASFRFGGEEFVVLLTDLNADAAQMVLNRFRTQIESFAFPQVGQVTVSIGAVQMEGGELAGTLIEKADKALYFSKDNGRNQVNIYHELVASGRLEEAGKDEGEIDLW